MVPCSVEVGVVPHGEHVAREGAGGLSAGVVLARVHRGVHPEVTILVGVGEQTVGTAEDSLVAHVGAHEGDVALLDAGSGKLRVGRIGAPLVEGVLEEREELGVLEAAEVVDLLCGSGREGVLGLGIDHRVRHYLGGPVGRHDAQLGDGLVAAAIALLRAQVDGGLIPQIGKVGGRICHSVEICCCRTLLIGHSRHSIYHDSLFFGNLNLEGGVGEAIIVVVTQKVRVVAEVVAF